MYDVLLEYAFEPVSDVDDLASAGGFSGVHLWRFRSGDRWLCLRRWPPAHPDERRLYFIHNVLLHTGQQGLHFLPVPLRTRSGETFVRRTGFLWEVTRWLPGRPDDVRPASNARVSAAMRALAQFHCATESYPQQGGRGVPPGLLERRELLQSLESGQLSKTLAAVQRLEWPELRERAARYGELFRAAAPSVRSQLDNALAASVALQPCIRDIRREHVLFVADEVTGIVDFGALRHDSPAGDVARLLGGIAADDTDLRALALAAYRSVRGLTEADVSRINAYDASNVLMSVANWLRWIALENRTFDDPAAMLITIDRWLERLTSAVDRGGRW